MKYCIPVITKCSQNTCYRNRHYQQIRFKNQLQGMGKTNSTLNSD